ncbi:MAG: hypothetical protein D6681_11155 [Calditrichaeota bacterium]|nr:MAG: hypothetical protein D6681_11155 [Calditrichota bacterium]
MFATDEKKRFRDSRRRKSAWAEAWSHRPFQHQCLLAILFLGITLGIFANFVQFVEHRPGALLPDPIQEHFSPRNFTWPIFVLIYGSLAAAIYHLSRYPTRLVLAVQTYGLMVLMRLIAMYLTPLEPPPSMILLKDPFVELFTTSTPLTRDLFFSGHTSTMFLLFLVTPHARWRSFFLLSTILIGIMVIWQHVHYAIDVFAAPFFAYGSYRMAWLLWGKKLSAIHRAVVTGVPIAEQLVTTPTKSDL